MNLNSLRTLSYGMTIVSSVKDDLKNAQIANTVFQITSSPVTLGISINKENLTYDYIVHSNSFALSVLTTKADFKFIGKFGFRSGRD
ncbi:MAG: flavin reductase, partial [Peptostreptococcales bacterium]